MDLIKIVKGLKKDFPELRFVIEGKTAQCWFWRIEKTDSGLAVVSQNNGVNQPDMVLASGNLSLREIAAAIRANN